MKNLSQIIYAAKEINGELSELTISMYCDIIYILHRKPDSIEN